MVACVETDKDPGESAEAWFSESCASCHGVNGDGRGTLDLPSPAADLRTVTLPGGNSVEAIIAVIERGVEKDFLVTMPGFKGRLPPEQIEAIARHVSRWMVKE